MPISNALMVLGATRLFALLAIGAPALWFRDREALLALVALSALWIYQGVTLTRRELELTLPPTVEAVAVGVICALGMEYSEAILAALVVPPLFATAVGGVRTLVRVVVFQSVTVTWFALLWWQQITAEQSVAIFTWTMAGVGLSWVAHYTFRQDRAADAAIAPYRDAQHLIRQLLELSDNLTSGLDVTALGGEMLAVVGDRIPNRGLEFFVPSGDVMTPVASSTELDDETSHQLLTAALDATTWGTPVNDGKVFAFRIGDSAVIAGALPHTRRTDTLPIAEVRGALASHAVKFDTALLFTRFRNAATADERQRLAREMHDGVAQDIASLGYLVDAIAARPADEQQGKQLAMLRDRVSGVVAEVRRSVMNLRTSIGEHESLGAAISAIARHLSESSGIPIRVRLDEQPTRLRPEVESELFRITQEAINNAVKHARATAIDVQCQVYAPEARITVTDNGVGLQSGRSDSHGLKIMRERARLIGARLQVKDNASRGVTVRVVLRPGHEEIGTTERMEERAS
ncbi:sensor histidine kinase [Nocardioides panacisoli]|uniref:sensor histidine kinase n=1 Tax=Nocardioides panacisoli TaxID=627624 RepID=UPI001C628471|nr:sensor histidine kinase [Nocardioides panacisoli]QYJ04717.1 sensor histidine kinase [Nocardioides panacisoli]